MSPEDSPQCAQVSYVISQILNATVQCNLFRQARKESTIFRSLLLDTSNECLIMRCSACILHAVISAVPTGWPTVTQLYIPDAYAAASYRNVLLYPLWCIYFIPIVLPALSQWLMVLLCCIHVLIVSHDFICQQNKSSLVKDCDTILLRPVSLVDAHWRWCDSHALISHWNEPVVHITKLPLLWLPSISAAQGQH